MRSNDAYLGLPHDIFCFTMLQELIAGSLSAKLGTYKHSVGSLHLYTENAIAAQEFLDEAFQDIIEMPAMPLGDQWPQLKLLLEIEPQIRNGEIEDTTFPMLNGYWADIARLIAIKFSNNARAIVAIKDQMVSPVYETYIRRKHDRLQSPPQTQELFTELGSDGRAS
ncbi:thymidylate synthase protein [Asticcacaulis biprosthecium C19]|uniref:Thymidylate synthase protein n=2 Tax=Asticcacaulis biprosthecium TaxID=76891 RepID=F4QGS0_9CAUL|nr:thymidylate synthase protein [Asticcacaulis biprosthecium C19]